ncbi:thiamine-phosphate kinase [Roseibium salinum]|uniref:Thiamine-monophosphate kinase n=1 Tax=Roseibium salinum TaxID=1604349 RepID=A0ABT3R221_9HYPH|nr:thiamine-phosphate kinase [Roseibium sp. DSM 29163]MCX2723297.1 thiamine-phosphate kinase [Roseibium sp. DSM 29163]MDN3718797.1 thiamine-phosphate kinase [Roseibium salinum]
MDDGRPGEFELIRRYFAPLAKDPGSLGLTDDAAVLTPRPGVDLVLTKDMLAADVHFFADDAPEAIAAKALRVNLSDLAAKGARPRGYLMGLALPADWTEGWVARFCNGLAADQQAYGVHLLGGDTIRSSNGLQVSITAIGEVDTGKAVRRSGARPGDILFVSGTIGDAAAGLHARLDPDFSRVHDLTQDEERHILNRYLLPRPRTGLAGPVTGFATAAMDISDGLIADSAHMARASGVGLSIDLSKVPLSGALQRLKMNARHEFMRCFNGGDDYEILASVSKDKAAAFQKAAAAAGCPVTEVGLVEEGSGTVRLHDAGQSLDLSTGGGFRHF